MTKTAKYPGGRIRSYWVGDQHVAALMAFRRRYDHKSNSEALRAILEVVQETEKESDDDETRSD